MSPFRPFLLRGLDLPEEPVGLLVRTGREEHGVGRARRGTVAELQRPQAIDHDGRVVRLPQGALELEAAVLLGSVRVDPPIAEVADQEVSAELSEALWRLDETPRRVEQAPGGNSTEE